MKTVDMPRHRRSFVPEYRVTAAHMVIDGHRRIAEVARELNVETSLLHTWVRDERWRMSRTRGGDGQQPDAVGGQPLSLRERAELVRLRQTVSEQANEIAFLEVFSAHFATAAPASRGSSSPQGSAPATAYPKRTELPSGSNSGYNCLTGPRKLTHLRWQ